MGKVKAQATWGYQGAGLLDVLAQDAAQRVVQKVGSGMVAGDVRASFGVHHGLNTVTHPQPT